MSCGDGNGDGDSVIGDGMEMVICLGGNGWGWIQNMRGWMGIGVESHRELKSLVGMALDFALFTKMTTKRIMRLLVSLSLSLSLHLFPSVYARTCVRYVVVEKYYSRQTGRNA